MLVTWFWQAYLDCIKSQCARTSQVARAVINEDALIRRLVSCQPQGCQKCLGHGFTIGRDIINIDNPIKTIRKPQAVDDPVRMAAVCVGKHEFFLGVALKNLPEFRIGGEQTIQRNIVHEV